jgi:deoxyribodipyrimidine photolyase-related protein
MEVSLVFPHQLFILHPAIKPGNVIYLLEDELFFTQYPFHKNKLILHRASMKCMADELIKKGFRVKYISANEALIKTGSLFDYFLLEKVEAVHYADTADYLLERRIRRHSGRTEINCIKYPTPNFICDIVYLNDYFNSGKKYFLARFYEDLRRRSGILMDGDSPAGGRWSFDGDNRRKMPKETVAPPMPVFNHPAVTEAKTYVENNFGNHYGSTEQFNYPVTHEQAEIAFQYFLKERFHYFGVYQDAIVKKEHFLFHSVLSSSINTGLLDPAKVVEEAVGYAVKNDIPFNSLEGFVRQVLGWREYIRIVYVREGVRQRRKNFMGFSRKLPHSFYSGETGIGPVDTVIKKILSTGYAHHIERLMILGNFMLLCEFHPDEVYQWFMELFIDAYDWVMVPNVYGMSQFADGGLMSTKPYVSSSNYILKMSDFKKGSWSDTWDALFWRFMHVHRNMLGKNPRLSVLLKTFDKMNPAKRNTLLETADAFLLSLDAGVISKSLF